MTISLAGDAGPVFDTELDALIARIRTEAGIDLRRARDPARAAITIEAVGRSDLARAVPQAACFVLPRRITWADFRGRRSATSLRWTDLERRDAAAIFVPADVSPQEIRDCVHEETAHALGPVNDLYRLEDSIFNDDNMHSVLTGFDMLILRTAYDPALENGMTRAEVAPPLAPAKAFSRSGSGRIFPLYFRVMREGLSTANPRDKMDSGSGRMI